jgi:hypothetical protein
MLKGILQRRTSPALIVSLMALVLAMGGFAMAAIPDGNGVINGCYKKKKGTLRLVSRSGKCKKSERAISWNQKGAAGAAGQAGARGDKGDKGDTGDTGAAGATNVVERYVESTTTATNSSLTANCNPGERATGGSSELQSGSITSLFFFEPGGEPVPGSQGSTPTGWKASWYNSDNSSKTIRVSVICASP